MSLSLEFASPSYLPGLSLLSTNVRKSQTYFININRSRVHLYNFGLNKSSDSITVFTRRKVAATMLFSLGAINTTTDWWQFMDLHRKRELTELALFTLCLYGGVSGCFVRHSGDKKK